MSTQQLNGALALTLEAVKYLNEMVVAWGYEGVFIVSFIGNFIPFLTVPYLVFVLSLSNVLDPTILSLISGLGATLGKLNSYFIGRGAGKYIEKSRYRRKFEVLKKLLRGYTFIAILVAAASPLPDDYVFIPVGLMKYSFWKTFLATLIGKIFLTLSVAWGGKATLHFLGLEESSMILSIILAVIFIVIMFIYMKFNVEDWIEKRFLGSETG